MKQQYGLSNVSLKEDASSSRMEWHTEGLLSFSALGRYNGVHIWGGMMERTSGMRPVEGSAQPDSTTSALVNLLQALSYVLQTPGWKMVAQGDTPVGFPAVYQHLRFKPVIKQHILCLIFTEALSSKPSLQESWRDMWTLSLSQEKQKKSSDLPQR